MPAISSLEAFRRAAADFAVTDLGLAIEGSALAAAQRSLDESGLLLLGEVHGVRENPLVIRALLRAFGLTSLALEWSPDLAPVARAFLAGPRWPTIRCYGPVMAGSPRATWRSCGSARPPGR